MDKLKVSLINLVLPEQKEIYPPFGILSIASALRKKEVTVTVFHERATKRSMESISEKTSDSLFVGLSVLTGKTIMHNLILSRMIKAQGIPVLWGGIHPTFLPGCTLRDEAVDYVIMGEGEKSICEFLDSFLEKKSLSNVKGLGYKKDGRIILNNRSALIDDLDNYKINWDDIFVPDYLRFEHKSLKFFPYLSSRGCPHRCGFCYNNDFNNRKWRAKSVNKVLEDILYLKDKYQVDAIDFIDDNFFTDKKRAFSITGGINLPWMAEVRSDYVDEDFMQECKKRNCYKLIMGCESGSDNTLSLIQKDSSTTQIENSIYLCYRYGIKVYCSFMIMLPGEKSEDRDKTIKFINGLMDRYPGIEIDGPKIYTPYPGTPLYKTSREFGWKEPSDLIGWSCYHRSMDSSLLGYVKTKDRKKYKILSGALAVKGDILKKLNSKSRRFSKLSASIYFLNIWKKISEWRLKNEVTIFPVDIKLYVIFLVLAQKLTALLACLGKRWKR